MKKILILLSVTYLMTSCRMYERDYLDEIPIPSVVVDTIGTGDWEDPR